MATVPTQKDLIASFKKETCVNLNLLSQFTKTPAELSKLKPFDNMLEKPTQHVFNHLSHYLVSIINPRSPSATTWPIYDTKTERGYRKELSIFITELSSKSLLSSIPSSYLVNPGCYKVIRLIYEMSLLAVQKILETKMNEKQRSCFNDVTEKYKSSEKNIAYNIDCETITVQRKISNHLMKRQIMENIAKMLREKIIAMELATKNGQKLINEIVDTFIAKHNLDDNSKNEISLIKDVEESSAIFESWLSYLDKKIDEMESKWSEKMSPFVKICQEAQLNTEILLSRFTGQAEKSSFMVEYNHNLDEIKIDGLLNEVNTQQQYILKSIVRDEKLVFPNLIRSFLVAISFIMNNEEIGDEIYKFNEYLLGAKNSYNEVFLSLHQLSERVTKAESCLQPSSLNNFQSTIFKDIPEIPPLPNVSDLFSARELQCQTFYDTFTPLSTSKYHFNMNRKNSHGALKANNKFSLITPFYRAPRDDLMTSLITCRVSSYDNQNKTHKSHAFSASHYHPNETIAECPTGFTKDQIARLLSTKKKSSTKKNRHQMQRPNMDIRKGALFNNTKGTNLLNESTLSNDSCKLLRSQSSPNLFENRKVGSFRDRPISMKHQLSIMIEDNLSLSGIAAFDSSCEPSSTNATAIQEQNIPAIPKILVTNVEDTFHNTIKNFNVDLDQLQKDEGKSPENLKIIETPKNNVKLVSKTSSLEKIINRYKKVKAKVHSVDTEVSGILPITEEKVYSNIEEQPTSCALLPDLLSPSCSALSHTPTEYLDKICMELDDVVSRKPRQSLGTALGVDHNFLDEFDLID